MLIGHVSAQDASCNSHGNSAEAEADGDPIPLALVGSSPLAPAGGRHSISICRAFGK
jgi:hypothetical protein